MALVMAIAYVAAGHEKQFILVSQTSREYSI
jgi:hypothetical protein